MRINVYAEELTTNMEVVRKAPDNHPDVEFRGIRMYLASPSELHSGADDDDRSAITLWVPWTRAGGHKPDVVVNLLRNMANLLELEYERLTPHLHRYQVHGKQTIEPST